MRVLLSILFILISINPISAQELSLPKVFSDHMVLQRDADVRIWGKSKPSSTVTVMISDISVTTEANINGHWEAFLPKHKAGGPHTITIDSRKTISFSDVYFGDVWIAGGQSNMEWQIGDNIDNMEAELNDAEYPEIRFFKVSHDLSTVPLEDLTHDASWKPANKENAEGFSAVAWFFAKHNHKDKSYNFHKT